MRIPKGMNEEEILEVIERVVNRLAYKFRFGYHDVNDLKQQGRLYAIQGMDSYDESRPLENFLWTHVRNRLFNFKRDNLVRPSSPCDNCLQSSFLSAERRCEKYGDPLECKIYYNWWVRNQTKRNIMEPIELSQVRDEEESGMRVKDTILDEIICKEIQELIEQRLPIHLRRDWLLCLHGSKISKSNRDKLKEAIDTILEEHHGSQEG
jgi:DNA-directed RNA polymerase specialized sigma subunit